MRIPNFTLFVIFAVSPTIRKSPNMSLKQENDMLRNVIQQNLRDLKSLHNEMSLHIELEKQRDQQIDAEKQ